MLSNSRQCAILAHSVLRVCLSQSYTPGHGEPRRRSHATLAVKVRERFLRPTAGVAQEGTASRSTMRLAIIFCLPLLWRGTQNNCGLARGLRSVVLDVAS
ncbi:hypothetical protein BD311DRAFT_767711 [Dichomitus squalens]|uniref:Uncharacterized protein n=1 Tax=Dichomitus squalens TaxID=114155 RepID=A0A4Q9MDC1_9APHY|nr:hypothetical protein BD311DRAFT_767711 [Dichomitus squalens]